MVRPHDYQSIETEREQNQRMVEKYLHGSNVSCSIGHRVLYRSVGTIQNPMPARADVAPKGAAPYYHYEGSGLLLFRNLLHFRDRTAILRVFIA